MNILVVVTYRQQADFLNQVLKEGSRAVIPGDALTGQRFDMRLNLSTPRIGSIIQAELEKQWFDGPAITCLAPGATRL